MKCLLCTREMSEGIFGKDGYSCKGYTDYTEWAAGISHPQLYYFTTEQEWIYGMEKYSGYTIEQFQRLLNLKAFW